MIFNVIPWEVASLLSYWWTPGQSQKNWLTMAQKSMLNFLNMTSGAWQWTFMIITANKKQYITKNFNHVP
jgi:hypothetical protein